MRSQKYSYLTLVFYMIEFTFFTLESQSFQTSFSIISFISGKILSLQFSSKNFIHFNALSDVEVLFFSANISFSNGITLLKLTLSYRLINVMFCIKISLTDIAAKRTDYSSCDISNNIASKIQSNLYRIIFLNNNFWPRTALPSICTLKKEKSVLNHPSAVKLEELGDFPLAMAIKVPTILLMISSVKYCSNFPY